jgi:hypothetical protein
MGISERRANGGNVDIAGIEHRLHLSEALRRYWMCLLGTAVFWPAALVVGQVVDVPDLLFIAALQGVHILGAWPWRYRNAPFSFCLISLSIFAAGFVFVLVLGISAAPGHFFANDPNVRE